VKKKIIFVTAHESWIKYYIVICKNDIFLNNFEPYFLADSKTTKRIFELGLTEFKVIDLPSGAISHISRSSMRGVINTPIINKLQSNYRNIIKSIDSSSMVLSNSLSNLLIKTAKILFLRKNSKKLLKLLKPQIVCIPGDNAGNEIGDFLRISACFGASVVTLPVTISQQENIARLRQDKSFNVSGPISKMIFKKFPKQCFFYEGKNYFYYPMIDIISMWISGFLPKNPWVLGMSVADQVFLSNPSEANYWISRGLSKEKLKLVGFLELDEIRLSTPPILQIDSGYIVYAVAQLAEHGYCSWEKHWTIITSHLDILLKTGFPLKVVLHPKSILSKYIWLKDRYGCKVTQGDTANQLVECILYVCLASTTAFWAANMGIRVLILADIYKLEMPAFDGIETFTRINELQEFAHTIECAFQDGKPIMEDNWYINKEIRAEFIKSSSASTGISNQLMKV